MAYPARGDEMINQEAEALLEAEDEAEEKVARSTWWLPALPVLAMAGGAALYGRGRRPLGAVAVAGGVALVTASFAFRLIRSRIERDDATRHELEELDRERIAIETGRL